VEVIAVDLFAGGGGASLGIKRALGVEPVVAVNHDLDAIEMHKANHPNTLHLCESVFDVRPHEVVGGRRVDLLWASPDCTHFSRAKGGKPRDKKIRALAWVIVQWAEAVAPRVIAMENVPEFVTWGPLDDEGQPDKARAGETFREFVARLERLGYAVEWRNLVAADYGAPTTRKRFFLVARRDGRPIRWPSPTHGAGRERPWRTAAECIDWSVPVPSIFGRRRPLKPATERRIAEGIRRYVLTSARPFIVCLTHGGRVECVDDPLRTITTANGGERALVAPTLIQCGYGEREGQAPRVLDIEAPLGTIVAGGNKHALVTAFLAKHYGGVVGQPLDRAMGTVTAVDHHSLVTGFLTKAHSHGWDRNNGPNRGLEDPAWTVTARDGTALVAAFLLKYYGSGGQWSGLDEPMHTIVAKARMGLVAVDLDGTPYALADIGMRMLTPRELARAQGFPDSYVMTGSKANQIARIGNSAPPDVVEHVVAAQFEGEAPLGDVEDPSLFQAWAAK
jgi:DNA (cytosine-5)-methyltransferase 1